MNPWFMTGMDSYIYGRAGYKPRSAEQIQLDIDKTKKEAEAQIDAAWLDRRSYCLTNALINIEREIPVLEAHLQSLEEMPDEVKKDPSWFMDKSYVVNRVKVYKQSLDEGNAELALIKTKLKAFKVSQDTRELQEEMAELADTSLKSGDSDVPASPTP